MAKAQSSKTSKSKTRSATSTNVKNVSKKTTPKKASSKKAAAKKTISKKIAAKKSPVKKVIKKATVKKVAPKKAAPKKRPATFLPIAAKASDTPPRVQHSTINTGMPQLNDADPIRAADQHFFAKATAKQDPNHNMQLSSGKGAVRLPKKAGRNQ